MVKLECWLPNKEMFGVFALGSVTCRDQTLKIVMTNEVYKVTISFLGSIKSYEVTETVRKAAWLDALRADYGVLMRGNTFFRLLDARSEARYLIVAPNYVAQIDTDAQPSVTLEKAEKG